jgi:hypothetical protein
MLEAWPNPIRRRQLIATMNFCRCMLEAAGIGPIPVPPAKSSRRAGPKTGAVHVPFGGLKGSGFGPHERGRAALEFYTEVVTVFEDT